MEADRSDGAAVGIGVGEEGRSTDDDLLSFVFIVWISCRISKRSTEVKLDWLWLRERDGEWTVESEHSLS